MDAQNDSAAVPPLKDVKGPDNRVASLLRLVARRPPSPGPETDFDAHGVRISQHTVDADHLERYRASVRSLAAMPLAYPATVTMPLHLDLLAAGGVPVRPLGMVYLGFDVQSEGCLSAERPWQISAWVSGTRHTKSGMEFDTVAEITEADSDGSGPRWRTRSALLMRSKRAAGEDASEAPDVPEPDEPWEAQLTMNVAENTGRTFAQLNGDFNPIHMHKYAAKPFGFPRAIAHGWWSLGRVLAMLEEDEPNPDQTLRSTISFRKPVLCPSRPTLVRRGLDDGTTRFALLSEKDPSKLLVGGAVTRS